MDDANYLSTINKFVASQLFAFARQPESCEGEQAVKHQQFVAEAVTPQLLNERVEGIAEQGRRNTYIRCETVTGHPLGEKSEDKQAE